MLTKHMLCWRQGIDIIQQNNKSSLSAAVFAKNRQLNQWYADLTDDFLRLSLTAELTAV